MMRLFLAALLLALAVRSSQAELYPVDLELVLAVDASGSVDAQEWALQLGGIAAGFRDPAVIGAIQRQPLGRIAVVLVVWSEGNRPKDASPWFLVSDDASAEAFAAMVESYPRRIPNGGTGIGKAIQFSVREIERNAFTGSRRVIDISGDGRETPPADWSLGPAEGRAFAAARGIVINGLAVLSDDPGLADYYRREVILGPDSFVIAAADYEDFAEAMRRKLLREIETEANVSWR